MGDKGVKQELLLVSPLILVLLCSLLIDILIGDRELFTTINGGIISPVLDVACGYISIILFSASSILSLVALCFFGDKSSRRDSIASGLIAIASAFISYGFGSVLKPVFGRPRPFEVLNARVVGIWHTSTFSFPSTTTMFVFGFALPILYEKPKLGVILILEALFVGFSVIYTGFHYPADVIAGASLSIGLTILTNMTKRRISYLLKKNCGAFK